MICVFSSSASSPVFLSSGVTTAVLTVVVPHATIIAVRYGGNTSTISFSSNVGMGSSAQDLVGDCMMSRQTSSSLHGDSVDSDTSAGDVVDVGSC